MTCLLSQGSRLNTSVESRGMLVSLFSVVALPLNVGSEGVPEASSWLLLKSRDVVEISVSRDSSIENEWCVT